MTSYDDRLMRLRVLLEAQPLTAKQIAKRMGCCLPAVYERIAALRTRGVNVVEQRRATKSTGPKPVAFNVVGR